MRDLGATDHLTMNCQVGSAFTPDVSERVNYANNFYPRLTYDLFSTAYNPSWGNHPDFSFGSNDPPMPQMNFKPPSGF